MRIVVHTVSKMRKRRPSEMLVTHRTVRLSRHSSGKRRSSHHGALSALTSPHSPTHPHSLTHSLTAPLLLPLSSVAAVLHSEVLQLTHSTRTTAKLGPLDNEYSSAIRGMLYSKYVPGGAAAVAHAVGLAAGREGGGVGGGGGAGAAPAGEGKQGDDRDPEVTHTHSLSPSSLSPLLCSYSSLTACALLCCCCCWCADSC